MKVLLNQKAGAHEDCFWSPDGMPNLYKRSCWDNYRAPAGGLVENGVNFCPYCGKKIAVLEEVVAKLL